MVATHVPHEEVNGTQDIFNAISLIGFPAVMCCIMLFYIKDINEKHSEESEKFTEMIRENTVALTQLCEKIERLFFEKEEK